MIKSRKEFKEYLQADLSSYYGREVKGVSVLKILFSKQVKFIYLLRLSEYTNNCYKSLLGKFVSKCIKLILKLHEEKCGFGIPINVLGKGCCIVHLGPVIINHQSKIGEYCRIHVGVNIGTAAGCKDKCPQIGDRVYIGPGAKIFGDIKIADDIAIGANAVVNKDFTESNISIGGVPAKKISSKGSNGILYAPKNK